MRPNVPHVHFQNPPAEFKENEDSVEDVLQLCNYLLLRSKEKYNSQQMHAGTEAISRLQLRWELIWTEHLDLPCKHQSLSGKPGNLISI